MQPLSPDHYCDVVRRALAEDVGAGDATTEATVREGQRARGTLLARSHCVIAGLDVAIEAFRQLEPGIEVSLAVGDGSRCCPGQRIGVIVGAARTLLTAERTALNFLQRLSGIATRTRRFVDAAGGRITVLDTRKTTPTLRELEKYAVRVGGATNHRRGLFDAILIKDNHIRLAGGVRAAIERARAHRPDLPIEVETETLVEVDQALAARADIIMLDNMSAADAREAERRTCGRAKIEISGGVSLEGIGDIASTGADFVSVGVLTHSAPAVDLSFEIEPLDP